MCFGSFAMHNFSKKCENFDAKKMRILKKLLWVTMLYDKTNYAMHKFVNNLLILFSVGPPTSVCLFKMKPGFALKGTYFPQNNF